MQVLRQTNTISGGRETRNAFAQVHASVPCLWEPIEDWKAQTILGDTSGRVFLVSWLSEEIREKDRLIVVSGLVPLVGKQFWAKLNLDDRYRGGASSVKGYQTLYSVEEVLPRSA